MSKVERLVWVSMVMFLMGYGWYATKESYQRGIAYGVQYALPLSCGIGWQAHTDVPKER